MLLLPALATALLCSQVSIRANEPMAVAGSADPVRLEVLVLDSNGQPEPNATVALDSTVGTFGPLTAASGGVHRAGFTAPSSETGTVALIRAAIQTPSGFRNAFFALPIFGRQTLKLQARADTAVTAKVAGMAFGPVLADGKGDVAIAVTVPPGTHEAVVTTLDRNGRPLERTLPLKHAPFPRLRLVAGAANAEIAWLRPLALELFAVGPDGLTLTAVESVVAQTQQGALSEIQYAGGGVYRVTLLPPETSPPEIELEAFFLDEPRERARLSVRALMGRPIRLDVSATPPTVAAGDSGDVRLTATLVDASGNTRPAARAIFETQVGSVSKADDEGRGTLRLSDGLRQAATLVVHARSDELAGQTQVSVEPALSMIRRPFGLSGGAHALLASNLGSANGLGLRLEGALFIAGSAFEAVVLAEARGNGTQRVKFPAAQDETVFKEQTTSSLSARGGARFNFPVTNRASLIFGANIGVQRISGRVVIRNGPADGIETGGVNTVPAVGLGAGVSIVAGPGRLVAELGTVSASSTGQLTGNFGGITLSVGYLFGGGAP